MPLVVVGEELKAIRFEALPRLVPVKLTAAPARVRVRPLTVTVLVDESALVRSRLPVAARTVPPAGSGAFDSVSGTLPLTPPANVVAFVTRTSGAFDCVTAPAKVSGPPAK